VPAKGFARLFPVVILESLLRSISALVGLLATSLQERNKRKTMKTEKNFMLKNYTFS
jgi:hypothetical protein